MRKTRRWLALLALLGALVVVLAVSLDLYTEWAWFESLGFASVLWRRISAGWFLLLAGWFIASAVLLANWWLARWLAGGQMTIPWLRPQRTQYRVIAEPTTRVVAARVANALLALAALVVGFFFAMPVRALWLIALMSFYGVPVGISDPILGRDLSFYLFHLPWQSFVQDWLLWLILVAFGGAALVYLGSYSAGRLTAKVRILGTHRTWLYLPRAAERHLLLLGALAFGLLAWGYQLDIPQLLYSTSGAAYGAGYADIHARLPVLHVLTGVAVLGIVVLLVNLFVRFRWLPFAIVGLWLLVAFAGGSLFPALLQRLAVEPNELAREREYIAHTIRYTRLGYGLEEIVEDDFAIAEEAAPIDLAANQTTIKNIRLWDYRPLLRTYAQLQEIRLYYAFHDVDVDRYQLDDDYRQVMLAAREITQDQLPEQAQTWVNRHLVYTHGSGVVLSPVNEAVEEGLPRLWVRDIPPRSAFPELAITEPGIYYGELTSDYVIVATKDLELDYPSGDQNVYTTYEGRSGVLLNSPLKRLAYALRLGSRQVLLSGSITRDSQLLWRRTIAERVQAVAPFLRYDSDPYLVIVNGRLVWLLDAYTVSHRYPYSEPLDTPFGQLNYVRNSVKITVDAYDGSVAFYLIDPGDAVAATYAAIFPQLFRPVAEMEPALVAHWRYPEGLFAIQATKYQTFHMTDPQVFYNQEDLWSKAEEVVGGERRAVEPYYVIMRLPGEEAAEFVLMLPYTPATRQNMIAWLYARNDGPHYGQLGVYKFPKQRLIFGPMQIEARIDQDPAISQQLSLWNQRGSQVIRGNLLVIPIEQAVLYVEPIYLQAEASQLPELRRVVVAYGNQIAMEETLTQALARVMGLGVAEEVPAEPEPPLPALGSRVSELVRQAEAHYRAAQECLKTGDWACYGVEIDALAEVLDALVAATEPEGP
jgi:uncharacterized protein